MGFLEFNGGFVGSAVCQGQSSQITGAVGADDQTDFSEMVEDINEKVSCYKPMNGSDAS